MNEALLEKLGKLEALKERATTEAEAAAVAGKIAEICERHNIDIGSVRIAAEETDATEEVERGVGRMTIHHVYLANAVGKLMNVGHYNREGRESKVNKAGRVTGDRVCHDRVFFGLKANVAGAVVTYRYFLASVEALLSGWVRGGNALGRTGGKEFRAGCAGRILERVKEQVGVREKLLAGSEEHLALVRVGSGLVKRHSDTLGLRMKNGPSVRRSDAFSAGWVEGGRVDLQGANGRMLR